MQSILVMFRSDGQRRSFSVTRDMTVVGRREDCDLRIPLGEVSRKHARLVRDGDTLRLEDLGSSNGTYLNGQRVQEAVLSAGDSVQIGPLVFVLQIDGMPADEDLRPITADIHDQVASAPAGSDRQTMSPTPRLDTGDMDEGMDQGLEGLEPLPMLGADDDHTTDQPREHLEDQPADHHEIPHATEDVALEPLPAETNELVELDLGAPEVAEAGHDDEPLTMADDDLELAPREDDKYSDIVTMVKPQPPFQPPPPLKAAAPMPSPVRAAAAMVPPPPLQPAPVAATVSAPPQPPKVAAMASPPPPSKTVMMPPPPPQSAAPVEAPEEELDSFFVMDENSELDLGLDDLSASEEQSLSDDQPQARTPALGNDESESEPLSLSDEHPRTEPMPALSDDSGPEAPPHSPEHSNEHSEDEALPFLGEDAASEPVMMRGNSSGLESPPPVGDDFELDSLPPLDDSELDPLPPLDDSELDPLPPMREHRESVSEAPLHAGKPSQQDRQPPNGNHSAHTPLAALGDHSEPDALSGMDAHSEPDLLPFLDEESGLEELPLLGEDGDMGLDTPHRPHA